MKKASISYLVLFFAVLLTSLSTHAQRTEVLNERIQQSLRNERVRMGDLLRLSYGEQREMEVLSVRILAQSLQLSAQLEIFFEGRSTTGVQNLQRVSREIRLTLPPGSSIERLEMQVRGEAVIQSITAEVVRLRPQPYPYPQPQPYPQPYPQPNPRPTPPQQMRQVSAYSQVSISVNQDIRSMGKIDIERLLNQQYGTTFVGAEIEGVLVNGDVPRNSRGANLEVEINQRIASETKTLGPAQRQVSFLLQYNREEVRQGFGVVVRGEARIQTITVRVGQVRGQYNPSPSTQRFSVGQEVSSRYPLDLSRIMPYESRLIRSIGIEGRTRFGQADLSLVTTMGQLMGSVTVDQYPMRPVIRLIRPMAARDLRLQTYSQVQVDSLEIEFEQTRY